MPATTFSINEIEVLKEESFFRSKRIITEKIFHQLSGTVKKIQSTSAFKKISFPKGTDTSTGKISKGENYLGLPFIILDFPRLFSAENIFAYRTMVWWGNFVSCTLLISGDDVSSAKKNLIQHLRSLNEEETFLCVNESPWHHYFEEENFIPLKSLRKKKLESILSKQEFVKVARKVPLTQINQLPEFSAASFEVLTRSIIGK